MVLHAAYPDVRFAPGWAMIGNRPYIRSPVIADGCDDASGWFATGTRRWRGWAFGLGAIGYGRRAHRLSGWRAARAAS